MGDDTFDSTTQNATSNSRPTAMEPSTHGLVQPVVESP